MTFCCRRLLLLVGWRVVKVHFQPLSPKEFCQLAPISVELYLQAMSYAAEMAKSRQQVWMNDSLRPGFKAACAHDGEYLLGIAYGFSGDREHWWTQQISRGLFEQGGPTERERSIISNFFELAEIHVNPKFQGQGIGRELFRELVTQTNQPHVLLSTPEVEGEANNAFSLYRRLGFEDFLRHFQFRGDPRHFAVLHRNN